MLGRHFTVIYFVSVLTMVFVQKEKHENDKSKKKFIKILTSKYQGGSQI